MDNRPIVLARKPLSEKTITDNVLRWGTGGINIDACKIGNEKITTSNHKGGKYNNFVGIKPLDKNPFYTQHEGRFPSNFIIECICDKVIPGDKGEKKFSRKGGLNESDFSKGISPDPNFETAHYTDKGDIHLNPECPCRILDEQSGESKSTGGNSTNIGGFVTANSDTNKIGVSCGFGDIGGASRYFKKINK